jgi:hypothetical protein
MNQSHGTSSQSAMADHARTVGFGGGGPNAAAKYVTSRNAISSQNETGR